MSLIDMSAAETISRTLQSAPNAKIDPRIWLELSRCHSAIKEMAGLTDVVNNPPGGDIGGVPVNTYLQEQTIVTARALRAFGPYVPGRLIQSGGELQVDYCAYSSAPTIYTHCDVVSKASVAAGDMGEFVLRGVTPAYVIDLTSAALTLYKSRIYAYSSVTSTPVTIFTARHALLGATKKFGIAGVFLHAYAIGSISTCLIYFNPERTWPDTSA